MVIELLHNLIIIHLLVPLIGALLVITITGDYRKYAMTLSLWISGVELLLSLLLLVMFDRSAIGYQFIYDLTWLPSINISFSIGVDGISLFFIVLTSIRTPRCLLASKVNVTKSFNVYCGLFLMLEAFVQGVFIVTDRVAFYVLFEAVLIPMFLIIGMWGSRERKVRAAYFFFRYTLVGSLMMLMSIIYLYNIGYTTDIILLGQVVLTDIEERVRWRGFFLSLATKVPIVPVHIWLPEAHVEAPTGGSVILAGIRLKRGTYGIVRRRLSLFPSASVYFTPFVYMLCIVAILYASMTAIRQTDIKRIIAYASVAHMNITLVGVFSMNVTGRQGAIRQIRSHGLVAGALFMCVGVRYDRHHTRRITYYGGVAQTIPIYTMVFRFFTMANIALPGTSSFVGEFMILVGVFQTNVFVAFMSTFGIVLGGAYSRWLYNRVAYGNPKTLFVGVSNDLNRRELFIFIPLIVLTLFIGVYPIVFTDYMATSCIMLLEHVRVSV